MRISEGSAIAIGLIDKEIDVLPKTCYVLVGDRCSFNCSFCTQARDSKSDSDMLSRVIWPEFDDEIAYDKILDAYTMGKIWRVCIQTTGNSFEKAFEIVQRLQVPICISISANQEQVDKLIEEGVERVTISLDGATKEVYEKVKGNDFDERLRVLQENAKKYPCKIGTHLIVGLGEKEKEMIERIKWCYGNGINVALFAFTPIKGTNMENEKAPDLSVYRRIQAEHYKIKNKTDEIDAKAFETSGCEGCNRPYYNESVNGLMYNYPRKLTKEEFEKCKKELK